MTKDAPARLVKIEPLTEEAFEPFGEVLGPIRRGPDSDVPGNNSLWNSNFAAEGTPTVGFVLYQYLKPPTEWVIERLGQHRRVSQGVVPLEGKPCVLTCAPASPWGTKPDMDRFKAFLLDGTKGVVFHKLTWHNLGIPAVFPLHPPTFSIIDLSEVETQLELRKGGDFEYTSAVDLAEEFGAVIKLIW